MYTVVSPFLPSLTNTKLMSQLWVSDTSMHWGQGATPGDSGEVGVRQHTMIFISVTHPLTHYCSDVKGQPLCCVAAGQHPVSDEAPGLLAVFLKDKQQRTKMLEICTYLKSAHVPLPPAVPQASLQLLAWSWSQCGHCEAAQGGSVNLHL